MTEPNVCELKSEEAWNSLTTAEKQYAYQIDKACWSGAPIVLFQTSPESPLVFVILLRVFGEQSVRDLISSDKLASIPEKSKREFVLFSSSFFSNMGNYKSFGDTKILPMLPMGHFEEILKSSIAWEKYSDMSEIWNNCKNLLFSQEARLKQLGFGPDGISSYYSLNCSEDEAKIVQKFMDEKGISAYNTRLLKLKDGEFQLRIASANAGSSTPYSEIEGSHQFEGLKINITRGDYSPLLKKVSEALKGAIPYSANLNQKDMLTKYIESFENGSIDQHKDASRSWIKDKSPSVESYIGFIESYRDPLGVRGEWEGFVAVVNKPQSEKYSKLVNQAEKFLAYLPWQSSFEKDKFLMPDFTSLDVISFAGSGIPAGINIPNYDDIRQTEGFKNVSLGNVLSARGTERPTFLCESDQDLFVALQPKSFEVQVALHELLGHGSGKLLSEDSEGKLNFSKDVINPLTNKPIEKWYKSGQTYDSLFSSMSSTYEECKAESVGIYLCLFPDILQIFGYHDSKSQNDIIYVNWLNMVRAGLVALEFYEPTTKTWGQAHMQARYVILRVLLEAGEGLVKIEKTTKDNVDDLLITLDQSKIQTVGKEAIGLFLKKLQIYKSTADVESGKELYLRLSSVEGELLEYRQTVLNKKKPRPLYCQPALELKNGTPEMKRFEATHEGVIESFVTRYFPPEESILELWKKDSTFF